MLGKAKQERGRVKGLDQEGKRVQKYFEREEISQCTQTTIDFVDLRVGVSPINAWDRPSRREEG
jgi:hypothetical protein